MSRVGDLLLVIYYGMGLENRFLSAIQFVLLSMLHRYQFSIKDPEKTITILVSRMAMRATAEMMIRNLSLFHLKNVISPVPAINIKSVGDHGDSRFMGQ